MELYHQVSLTQQAQANTAEPEEEDEEDKGLSTPATLPGTYIAKELLSSLRDKLFTSQERPAVDTSTEHVLQHHRMLQDDLSDAMLGMARGLQQHSIAFGEVLKKDAKVGL